MTRRPANKNSQPATPPAAPAQAGWTWQTRLTLAVSLLAIASPWLIRHMDAGNRVEDEHINALIDAKVNPQFEKLGNKIDRLSEQIAFLSSRVAKVEGRLHMAVAESVPADPTLVPVAMHEQVLGSIRKTILKARKTRAPISHADLVSYKREVRTLPSDSYSYWLTVAELVNYQSERLQAAGKAPSPAKLAKPCKIVLDPPGSHYNLADGVFDGCVVDIDTPGLTFEHVLFRNSVIRYGGGIAGLKNVRFENCSFVISIPRNSAPSQPDLLQAIINAPSLTNVTVG